MSIEQYIKERIEELRRWNKYGEPVIENPCAISELQAVLSKIEELNK